MTPTSLTARLRPSDFIHPEDERALRAMQQIPLFPQAVKAFMKLGIEAYLQMTFLAEKIRLGPDQLPEVYDLVPPICRFFGIEEPMVFLESGPPNAYVVGDTKVFLVVTTGLLASVEEDELRAIIAHECGHIACRHMLYHTMANYLHMLAGASLPFVSQLSAPIRLALLYWSRRSEFSADRAAALYMRGSSSMVEGLIRISGGAKFLPWQINRDAYMKQAEGFNELAKSKWNDTLQTFEAISRTHPLTSIRASELDLWCRGQQFAKLMEGLNRAGANLSASCRSCGEPVPDVSRFCHHCGSLLSQSDLLPNNCCPGE
jgi:Zn-dependent protease with chaperone function